MISRTEKSSSKPYGDPIAGHQNLQIAIEKMSVLKPRYSAHADGTNLAAIHVTQKNHMYYINSHTC